MNEKVQNVTNKTTYFFNTLIEKRFILASVLFVLIVALKLHGSSITMWDEYVSDYQKTDETSGLLLGKPRAVRSDEWLVQTPYSFSQTQTGFKQKNEAITVDGQNMVVGYNSPALNLATLAKPFTWGYVLLGKEYGLSWYWGIKIIGLILFSFEMGMIITKKNKYLAILASIWIPFSAAIQWWFVSPVGDLVFFTLGVLVAIYQYFYQHENKKIRLFMSVVATICISGFVLVVYPALQVPLGYLILGFLVCFFWEFYRKIKLDRWDFIFIGGAVIATITILGISIMSSWDSLLAVMHTYYPGKRVSLGGELAKTDVFLFLTNWKMPFVDVSYQNNSEISSFYHFFFVILPLAPLLFFKKSKENFYGSFLFLYALCNLLWMYIKFPKIIAQVTLWSYVPAQRALLSFGFASVLLSLWFIQYIWEHRKIKWVTLFLVGVFNVAIYFFALYKGNLRLYVSQNNILLILFIVMVVLIALFRKWHATFLLMLSIIILSTGIPVNPVVHGVASIYDKKIAAAVEKIEKRDPKQLWAGERLMYGYLPMLGVHTFNGIAFTPNLNSWKYLDPEGKKENIYNRYAHINVEIIKQEENVPALKLLQKDVIVARLKPQIIKDYGIKYLITYKSLAEYSEKNIRFVKEYGPDSDGAYIYKVTY